MEQEPSEFDEQVHPPERAPINDPATGEDEPPNEGDIEPGVPPAFDPATKPPTSHP
jgi:hypothetical protein